MKQIAIKLIKWDEFDILIRNKLKEELSDGYPSGNVQLLLSNGFPKFDKNNLTSFFKDLPYVWNFGTLLIDFDNFENYWFITGNFARLVSKESLTYI